MIYKLFVEKLESYSEYNKIEKAELSSNDYNQFYNQFNPKQVEFEFNGVDLFMLPYSKISEITKEYKYLKCDYVFALSNSDPFFVKSGKVYTCCHGDKEDEYEFVADSFEEFLSKVVEEI